VNVLTAAQTREIDRLTIEGGVAGIALMENAAHRVAETMEQEFEPISKDNIVILCGKGNNGGDGLALARLMIGRVAKLRVVLAASQSEYKGDALVNLERLKEEGVPPQMTIPEKLRDRRAVTIVVDALLGTGLTGPPQGRVLELIRSVKEFPEAKVVAIDLPSGLGGGGECVRADTTVTFTAPKIEHYLADDAEENVGRLVVTQIGCPPQLIPDELALSHPLEFAPLFAPRRKNSHKGDYGHALVIGGAPGKAGAVAMSGLAALRMGAGWVTVACSDSSRLAPELMTEPLDSFHLDCKTVVAVGPGLGPNRELLARLLKEVSVPLVIDADGLNSIAGSDFKGRGVETILTPHPGEMARLLGRPVKDSVEDARAFARERNVCLVLKGHRTLVALPDGHVYINTSGSPSMAKAGSGDILTGMIAGLVAQFPNEIALAVRAAVWMHGRSGELAADELTDKCVIATDLLRFLPRAIRDVA
jgi:ADP-dependent NAD(P)H-hydrate dehydratase / NAD(P)H-hydrate epimerase